MRMAFRFEPAVEHAPAGKTRWRAKWKALTLAHPRSDEADEVDGSGRTRIILSHACRSAPKKPNKFAKTNRS